MLGFETGPLPTRRAQNVFEIDEEVVIPDEDVSVKVVYAPAAREFSGFEEGCVVLVPDAGRVGLELAQAVGDLDDVIGGDGSW